jgi:hypothetical protein
MSTAGGCQMLAFDILLIGGLRNDRHHDFELRAQS